MKDQAMKHVLEKAFPPLPQAVDRRIRNTLENASPQAGPRLRRAFPRLALAALLVLLVGITAVAAMQKMGVLHFTQSYMSEVVYETLPEAASLVHKNLAEIDRPEVTVRVEEAAYDGRILKIMYSITRKNAAAPFDKQAAENGEYVFDAKANGGFAANDWLVVNGVKVELLSMSTSAGDENGQLLYYVESSLTPPGGAKPLRPTGKMTVGLPIEWGENGASVPEGLTFTMDVGDAVTRYSLKLPEPVTLRGCRLQFTDLHFTPMQVSITYTLTIPAEMAAGKSDEELDPLTSSFTYGRLENDRGEKLGGGKDGPISGPLTRLENGDVMLEFYGNPTPSDQCTKVIYLITEGGDRIAIPMEPANKP